MSFNEMEEDGNKYNKIRKSALPEFIIGSGLTTFCKMILGRGQFTPARVESYFNSFQGSLIFNLSGNFGGNM